ncbi:MAG: regulatory protein RecX [Bacteroidales bacterium]
MDNNKKFNDALKELMKLCANREYCRQDIDCRLEKKGMEISDRVKILNLLVRDRFIDEERYSAAFVRDKFRYNRWGKVKIAAVLRTKGINENTIQQALGLIDKDEYKETLKRLVETHKKSVRAKNAYEMKGKLFRFAVSRGFESNLVYDVLDNDK